MLQQHFCHRSVLSKNSNVKYEIESWQDTASWEKNYNVQRYSVDDYVNVPILLIPAIHLTFDPQLLGTELKLQSKPENYLSWTHAHVAILATGAIKDTYDSAWFCNKYVKLKSVF